MYNFRSRQSKGKWPTTAELLDLLAGKETDEEQETGHRATRPSPWGSSTLALSTWDLTYLTKFTYYTYYTF